MARLYLILLFISIGEIFAQQYNFTHYSIEQGIPRSSIYSIMEDSRGYLWIGTEGGGVAKYDGREWLTYSKEDGLGSNIIRTIYEDKHKNIWFGSQENGVSKFDGEKFTNYNTENGLSHNTIRAICQDEEGYLWFGTYGRGICRFNPNSNKFSIVDKNNGLVDNKVKALFKDSKKNIWVGTDKGISKFDGRSFKNYTLFDGLPHNTILCIYEDYLNNIWFGTVRGAVRFNGKEFKSYTTNDGLIHNRVRAISQDNEGNMWFGTKMGVSRFDGNSFYNYTKNDGLSGNRIRAIAKDNIGNLWFGTYYGGVNKYNGDAFLSFTEKDGLSNQQIFSIANGNKNSIYVGTLDGVNIITYKNNRFEVKKLKIKNRLPDNFITSVYVDNASRLWVGTNQGLAVIIDEKTYIFNENNGLTNNSITTIKQDKNNNIWVGTKNGISKIIIYEPDNISKSIIENYTSQDELPGNHISVIYEDYNGKIWIGFKDAGISYYNGSRFFSFKHTGTFHDITSIVEDKNNNLWIGTIGGGVLALDVDNLFGSNNVLRNISKVDGLISNNIYLMLFDNDNNLLIGTEKGLEKIYFDKKGFVKKIKHFGRSEGFIGLETSKNAVCVDTLNNIWFGTLKGVIRYSPSKEFLAKSPPKTHITNVRLFYENVDWNKSEFCTKKDKWYNKPQNLVLPYNQNHVSFDFIGIDFENPDNVRYRWKLENLDNDWSPVGKKRDITYADLPPGKYTLKVKTSNSSNYWSKNPIEFSFVVLAPIWRRLWFIMSFLIIFIGIIFFLTRMRTLRLRRAKNILERKVKIRTKMLAEEKKLVELKNEEVLQRNEEIISQRDELYTVNKELEIKDKETTDSLNYALRIQSAILYSNGELQNSFSKSFVFLLPRNIVSGDFYWFYGHNNVVYIAAADCTGHGVPGAFMSIIGHSLLSQIIEKYSNSAPSKILTELHKEITGALLRDSENRAKDGMDIALCKIVKENKTIEFSGAFRPMFFLEYSPDYKITVHRGNRAGIGGEEFQNVDKEFTTKKISYKEKDRFYIFSDGIVDQFGGERGKKYMSKRLKELFLTLKDVPMVEQKKIIQKTFYDWKGMDNEQADDVLLIGVEL